MSQQQLDRIVAALRASGGPAGEFSVELARRTWYRYTEEFVLPPALECRAETIGAMRVEWLSRPRASRSRAVLYLHGGGYICGGIESHRPITAGLAEVFDGAVVSIDYRLAPEHPFPAPVQDTLAGYRYLLGRGIAPARIALAGESAGGGLAAGAMLALAAAGLPRPAAGWIVSPWSDLTHAGRSITANAATDPIVFKDAIDVARDLYLAGAPRTEPFASPANADLAGLPPLLIQVATAEILLDDAFALARQAAGGGVEVTLEAWPGLVHAWHLFAPGLDEARAAIRRAGEWLDARL